MVDIKGLGIGELSDYVSFRAKQGKLKLIDRRAVKVHKEYCKAAKGLDSKKYHRTTTLRMMRWPGQIRYFVI